RRRIINLDVNDRLKLTIRPERTPHRRLRHSSPRRVPRLVRQTRTMDCIAIHKLLFVSRLHRRTIGSTTPRLHSIHPSAIAQYRTWRRNLSPANHSTAHYDYSHNSCFPSNNQCRHQVPPTNSRIFKRTKTTALNHAAQS